MRRDRTAVLILAIALLTTSACSSMIFRRGQPTVIGDLQPGTPSHVYVTNDAGQLFRLQRDRIYGTRMGGMRTTLWSLLTGYAAVLLVPAGLLQWWHNVAMFDAVDGAVGTAVDAVDEVEVDASGVDR